jgi:uncharacterized protein (DUF433 family)
MSATIQETEVSVAPGIVRRADRGLCVEGTRITLYLIMDHLKEGWTPHLLADQLLLDKAQIDQVMEYIASHREEFEAEYQEVVRKCAERERYWRERERERRKSIPQRQPRDAREAIIAARLQALRNAGKLQ